MNAVKRIAVVFVVLLAGVALATPPTITQVTVSPSSISSLPATQTYTVQASGTVSRVVWDFGDGQRNLSCPGGSGTWSSTRTVTVTGQHAATVYVIADTGEVAQQKVTWSATTSGRPTLTVSSGDPITVQTVTSSSYSISGTASGTGISLLVSTDRGQRMVPTGTTSWSGSITLKPGLNRIVAQVKETDGDTTAVDRMVRYTPSSSITVSGITESASSVQQWNMEEISFTINNSGATNPYVPYEPTAPGVLASADGITVNGVFWQAGGPEYVRPAFLYQNYTYDTTHSSTFDWYYPSGSPTWKVRFSPPATGTWYYRIDVTEAKGTASSSQGDFSATSPTGSNHGPIVQSPSDSRYYEYADGTVWLGNGYNLADPDDRQHLRWNASKLTSMGTGNENYIRLWLSGDFFGSNWNPWPSVDIGLDGNPPGTGLSLYSGYGDSIAAMKLDYSTNRVIMQGWMKEKAASKTSTSYRIRMLLCTEGITGPINASYPYGVTIKSTSWPYDINGNPITYTITPILTHINKNIGWHWAEATLTTSASQWFLANSGNYFSVLLENCTAGKAFIDRIEAYELDGSGNVVSENVLRGNRMSFIQNIDPMRAWTYDQMLAQAQSQGIAYQLCLTEKQDYLLDNLDSNGLPLDGAASFFANSGHAANKYQRWYWRYVIARFGAYQSVFGYEHCNEANPDAYQPFDRAKELAQDAAADGNPHFGGTSLWTATGSWEANYEAAGREAIGWVDGHRYETVTDFASFYNTWSLNWYGRGFGKPIVAGEMGSDTDSSVASDTGGIWLRNYMWAHTGHGGLHTMYWYYANTFNNNLHWIYGAWRTFMADVPLTNGFYVNASGTCSNTNMESYGQKDLTLDDRAHLWIRNKNWSSSNPTPTAISGTVTVTMAQASMTYDVYWINTATGGVASTTTLTSNGSKVVTLTVNSLSTDTAVKLIARTPPPNAAPTGFDDYYKTGYGQTLVVTAPGVLGNDSDPNGDTLTVASVQNNVDHGTLTLNANGSFTYTPTSGYYGTDQFQYQLSDGEGGYASAWGYICVQPNLVSATSLVAYQLFNESTGTLAYDGAINGSYDDSGTLTNGGTWAAGKINGGLTLDGSNDCVNMPATNDINSTQQKRSISVWFKVTNKALTTKQVIFEFGGSTRGMSIYVCNSLLYVGGWNTPGAPESGWTGTFLSSSAITNNTWHHVAITLDGSDTIQSNVFKGYLDGSSIGSGNGSTIWAGGNGNCLGYNNGGTRFHDGTAGSAYLGGAVDELYVFNRVLTPGEVSTLALQVSNQAPVAADDPSYATNENTTLAITAPGVLGNDTDPDGDTITVTQVTNNVDHGSLTLNANGSFTYTPTTDWYGTDAFTYEITDGNGGYDTAVATITVNEAASPVTVYTTNDAYVSSASPTSNFGTTASIQVRYTGGAVQRQSYVWFDLSGVGFTINGATLRVYQSGTAPTSVTVDVYASAASWVETGVTWNTKPATSGGSLANFATRTDAQGVNWVDITLPASTIEAMRTGNNYGLVLIPRTGGTGNTISFHSREAANDAQLVVSP